MFAPFADMNNATLICSKGKGAVVDVEKVDIRPGRLGGRT